MLLRIHNDPQKSVSRFSDGIRSALNASPLPLFQAAPGFFSVGRGGRATDGRTTAHQQEKRKHHVKKKYIKRDTEKQTCEEGEKLFIGLTGTGSACSKARQRANGRGAGQSHKRYELSVRPTAYLHCVCVPASGGDRAFTGLHLQLLFFLVKRLLRSVS